jgi:transposase
VDARLDLGFVREWARERYAERGRPSIDPVVFFTRQLIMLFAGIRSERQLVETASLNLAHRWYLGDAPDEALPHHSRLTRIRQRLGVDVFERFFEQVVDLCQAAGLVWGRERSCDATKVRANANLDSLVPRFSQEAKRHLAGLFVDEPVRAVSADERLAAANDRPAGIVRLPSQPAGASLSASDSPWRRRAERRLDPQRPPSGSDRRTSAFRVSATDPDATPMPTKAGTALGYHDHSVVDGGKHRIVLAALVTPADVMENVPMRDLLWRVRFRRKLWPRQVTGDTTSGTIEHIVALEDAGIRADIPLTDWGLRRPAFFGPDDFVDDAEADTYRCPAGHPLRRNTAKDKKQVVVYRGDPAVWNTCSLKATCTKRDHGRVVHRSCFAADRETVRAYHTTEADTKAMQKRKVWVEPR